MWETRDDKILSWRKALLIGGAVLAVLGGLYYFSYKSAYLWAGGSSGDREYSLVIFGWQFPYTPTAGRAFSTVYAPLIACSASEARKTDLTGTIFKIDPFKAELIFTREDKVSLLIHVPASMIETLKSFAEGDGVRVAYVAKSIWGNPFCYDYHLAGISRVQ